MQAQKHQRGSSSFCHLNLFGWVDLKHLTHKRCALKMGLILLKTMVACWNPTEVGTFSQYLRIFTVRWYWVGSFLQSWFKVSVAHIFDLTMMGGRALAWFFLCHDLVVIPEGQRANLQQTDELHIDYIYMYNDHSHDQSSFTGFVPPAYLEWPDEVVKTTNYIQLLLLQ